MDEVTREGFADTEIVRGVLRIIKPSTFRDMLINKDDLTVTETKGFLQAHLGEKNSTELFAGQDENETQQSLYRVIGLKQHLNCQMQASRTLPAQDAFLHSVYRGLGNKCSDIRREVKPVVKW